MKTRILALFVATAGFASAATIVQTQNFSFVPTGSQSVSFSRFDTMSGTRTLTGVTITLSFTKSGGSVSIDNEQNQSGTFTFTSSVNGYITTTGAPKIRDINGDDMLAAASPLYATDSVTQTLSATTGDDTNTFNATGLGDYYRYDAVTTNVSNSASVHSDWFGAYQGVTPFSWTFNSTNLSGANYSGISVATTPVSLSGSVTVTYNYVPEPSAALIGGLGFLCLLRRRR